MKKISLFLIVFAGNTNAMDPVQCAKQDASETIYLGNWQNRTAHNVLLSFSNEQGNQAIMLPAAQAVPFALNRKIATEPATKQTGRVAVVSIEKLAAGQEDTYKNMSVLLALALSAKSKVFTSVVLPPVQVSEKARTFLDLVEAPAPFGINFDGVIHDGETSFVAMARNSK